MPNGIGFNATAGLDWRPVKDFSAAIEAMADANLKQVFEEAIERGFAIVTPG